MLDVHMIILHIPRIYAYKREVTITKGTIDQLIDIRKGI